MMPEQEAKIPFGAKAALHNVLTALKELGGYFVFSDDDGKQFVVARREDFEAGAASKAETQLSLSEAPVQQTADDVLERINREIALYQMQQEESQVYPVRDMLPKATSAGPSQGRVSAGVDDLALPKEPPRRVRFEPIHGDLPPELQE